MSKYTNTKAETADDIREQERQQEALAKKLLATSSKTKRIILTTVVPNAKPYKAGHQALEHFSKRIDAEIIYLKTLPLYVDDDSVDSFFDPAKVVGRDMPLNSTLLIRASMRKKPHVRVPIKRAVKNLKPSACVILPGTRQEYAPLPRMGEHPRMVITPGAVTEPNYKQTDTGSDGALDHFLGAVLLEYNDHEFFPFNLQFLEDGAFVHMGELHSTSGKVRKLTKEEIVRVDGDDHAIERDKAVTKVLVQLQKHVPAGTKVSHDTFDGKSINHHEEENFITQAQKAKAGEHALEHERKITVDFLVEQEQEFDRVVVVPSNHNHFLNRFNQAGKYIHDKVNWFEGSVTSLAQFFHVDPVKFFLLYYKEFVDSLDEYMGALRDGKAVDIKFKAKPALERVHFLRTADGEKFIFGGIDLSAHGDQGPNGAKGNPEKMDEVYGNCVTGHNHKVWLRNRSGGGGTTSIMNPDYVRGKPSSWGQGCVLTYAPKGYDLGAIQVLPIFKGKYRL